MKRRMTRFYFFLSLTVVFLTFSSLSGAEILHQWVESLPDHAFQNGDIVEYPFNTYTSKSATRSESGGSWSLTALATASANCQALLPAPGDVSREWNVDAKLRATGDLDTLKTESPDGLLATEKGIEETDTSSDGTTTARRARKAHIVYYRNRTNGGIQQRAFNTSTSGDKSKTSVSPSGLDADPWAKSVLVVNRRINLAEQVDGSPFQSETPDCSSSGIGHTCQGATPPPKKRDTVYCRQGDACGNKPGVEGNREAHKIDCPERTYKQGVWAWLLIKLKENCKGEKWSCHQDPNNCKRKHLHLKPASEASENEMVVDGFVVPTGYSVGACGEHMYASGVSSAADHAQKTGACGHTYYVCSQGDHDELQASCDTDTNCTTTNFYACQTHTHEYTPPCPICNKAASTSAIGSHPRRPHLIDCSICNRTYYSCLENHMERHKPRTCVRCSVAYADCQRTRDRLCPGYGLHIDEAPPIRCCCCGSNVEK